MRWFSTASPEATAANIAAVEGRIAEHAEEEEKEYDPKIVEIVDSIVELNLLEVTDLTLALRDRLGLFPEEMGFPTGFGIMGGGGMQQGAVGAAQGGAPEEEKAPVVEKTLFDLQLEGWDAKDKIKVIKEVRAITGLGLKEAKALVEDAPKTVKKEIKKEEAEELMAKLEKVGAKVAIL